MPNTVYEQAHRSLAALVSARAASRMLDQALVRVKLTPESVDAASMSELLMGPVLQELEDIFPRSGVQRQLSGLVRTLQPVDVPVAAPPPPPLAPAPLQEAPPAERSQAAPLPLDRLEQLVLSVAQIPNIRFVGAFRQDGNCAVSRGEGPDAGALQEGLIGVQRLERKARLRSFGLVTKSAQLFVFPVGQDLLALIGNPQVNVGVVHQTLSTLKEEL